MGAIYDEFVQSLASWRIAFAGHPERELLHLLLLALEREEVVSVGYRESLIARRLSAMPVTDEVRLVVRQAMAWTWQDEEMHAVYIRGALLKLGRSGITFSARISQLAGALGGWASSVRQHLPWSRAPVARAAAALLTCTGVIFGKVPRQVREHLRYRSFRDFCLFNIDTEATAALCFSRLHELIAGQTALPAVMADDFMQVRRDEERHSRLFAVLAEAFDQEDRLVDGLSIEELARRIGAIDGNFLPRSFRAEGSAAQPFGGTAPVYVAGGDQAPSVDKGMLLEDLLERMRVPTLMAERAAALGKEVGELKVAIKPSFMFAYHHRDPSPITDPALVMALAAWLRRLGCSDIAVIESPSVYAHFFAQRSVNEVAAYVGIASPDVRIVDAAAEQVPHRHGRGMAQYTISRTWKEADVRISFGKLRSHPTDQAMLTLSNLEWLGASHDELLFAERQAHRQTATVMQIAEFPTHLAILDAFTSVPDGVVGMMGSRHARAPHRLYASTDALAVDVVIARHLGMRDPREALFIRTAFTWFGVTAMDPEVRGCDAPIAGWHGPRHSGWSAILSMLAFPVYLCASGRGTLFVPAMDERAFPPVRRIGWCLRLGRWLTRRLLGLETGFRAESQGSPR